MPDKVTVGLWSRGLLMLNLSHNMGKSQAARPITITCSKAYTQH